MAKIYGVELKNITNFKGHEGEPLIQGNIYFNGKKVGYYSQDFMSGPDTIAIDSKDDDKKLHDLSQKFLKNNPYGLDTLNSDLSILKLYSSYPIEGLMGELCMLIECEKDYKKAVKKGYKYAVYTKETNNSIMKLYYVNKEEDLENFKNENSYTFVMSSPDQFNIKLEKEK